MRLNEHRYPRFSPYTREGLATGNVPSPKLAVYVAII